jgi:hypothetical protein
MRKRIAAAAFAAFLGMASAAQADIFAVVEVAAPAPRTDLDVALVNVNTGARVALPPAVNTTANELHPSVTPNARRLVFERRDPAAGTVRIVLVDLVTKQAADLFNGFEAAADPPRAPAISEDGLTVATAGAFRVTDFPSSLPRLLMTDVSTFPAGPYARSTYTPPFFFPNANGGQTADPFFSGENIAFRFTRAASPRGGIAFGTRTGTAARNVASATTSAAHPSVASPGGVATMLFDRRLMRDDGVSLQGDIVFTAGGVLTIDDEPPVKLPAIVSSTQDESRPAFTSDGRYVAFVRHVDSRDRLFAWDSQTQTLVNATGVDLGRIDVHDLGNVSVYTKTILDTSKITSNGTVTFDTTVGTGIGILVQKVVGKRKLFGRTVPKLKLVGRVPLGTFSKRPGKVRWDLRVDGKRLKRGRYQVTVRAVTTKLAVRDFGRPRIIRVK